MHIIRSAVLKMTLYYLCIIMALSLGFSFFLYHVSSTELNRELRRPTILTRPEFGLFDYNQFRTSRLEESLHNVFSNLVAFNIGVLLLGGAVSYALARRTLYPIEEAMEAQSRFTADASHELRTPLTAMKTEIEVALRNQKLSTSEARQLLTSNLEEVAKLEVLSAGLLRLAHHDGDTADFRTVTLNTISNEAVKRVAKAAAAKSITFKTDAKSVKVQADKEALIEAVVILLDNAIKYSPAKTMVQITTGKQANYATVAIRDQGIGIKTSDLPHIFERFYRADASRTKATAAGYGLGLSIAQKIVGIHGGTIEATSQPNKGSTFTIKLPLHID